MDKKTQSMPPKRKNTIKTVGLIVISLIIIAFVFAGSSLTTPQYKADTLSYSELLQKVNSSEVKAIEENKENSNNNA